MNVEQILNHVKQHGGITLNHELDEKVFRKGYMVSMRHYETKLNLDEIGKENLWSVIKGYNEFSKRLIGSYVGLWVDEAILYLDISLHIYDKEAALDLAKKHEQIAIYGFEEKESIAV